MQVFLTTVVECDKNGEIIEDATTTASQVRVVTARSAEDAKILVARSLVEPIEGQRSIKIIAMPMKD